MVLSLTLQDVSLYPQTALAPLVKLSGRLDRNHSVLIGQGSEFKQQQIIYNDKLSKETHMNRYKGKAARWQQRDKEEQRMNKTEFIKVRCTLEEKQRIKSKAESTGRKFSDYCREILLNGEIIAVPKMTDNEREAIAILQHTGRFYGQVSNLIKVKDEDWLHITKNLSLCAKEAFKRFYDPHFRVDDEVYKVLNLTRNDRKM